MSKLEQIKKAYLFAPNVSKILLEFLKLSGFGEPSSWKESDTDVIEKLLIEVLQKGPQLENPAWFYDLQREIGVARFAASEPERTYLDNMLKTLTSGVYIPPYPNDPNLIVTEHDANKEKSDIETENPVVSVVDGNFEPTLASEGDESFAANGAETSRVREDFGSDDDNSLGLGLGLSGGGLVSIVAGSLFPAATKLTPLPRPDEWFRDYLARYDNNAAICARRAWKGCGCLASKRPQNSIWARWKKLKKYYDQGKTAKEAWDAVRDACNSSSSQENNLTTSFNNNNSSVSPLSTGTPVMASGSNVGVNPNGGSAAVSATLWASGAQFSADKVITHMSRTVFIPFQQTHRYTPLVYQGRNPENGVTLWPDHPVLGYQTPWFYLDVNAINRHFSPGEWQEVLERYGSIVPESMEVILADFCVKDVSVVDGKTTVTDSTTGGVCVFADDNYKYPYVLGQCQNTLPGPLPTDIYTPPQYAYLTTGKRSKVQAYARGDINRPMDTIAIPSEETAFYVLENEMYTIQRSGGGFLHTYSFPDLKPISLEGFSQHWMLMDNPLYQGRLYIPEKVGGQQKWRSVAFDDYGCKPLNWMPGPNIPSHTIEQSDHGDMDTEGQKVWTGTSFGSSPARRWSLRPLGVNQPYAYDAYEDDQDKIVTVDAIGYGTSTATAALGQQTGEVPVAAKVGRVPDDTECAKQGGGQNTMFHVGALGRNSFTEQMKSLHVPLLPGSVWQNRALHYESQIWAKIPETDGHFMCERPALGGWGMFKPPPQIFIKMQPVPAPVAQNSTTEQNYPSEHYLHQYAYCILTVRMTWKTTPRTGPTRWNPQPTVQPPPAEDHIPYILYDRMSTIHKMQGSFVNPYYEEPESVWTARGRVRHL